MATNLSRDPALLDRVVAVSGESTKMAAVTLALKEFTAKREQKNVSRTCSESLNGTPRITAKRRDQGRDAPGGYQRLVFGDATRRFRRAQRSHSDSRNFVYAESRAYLFTLFDFHVLKFRRLVVDAYAWRGDPACVFAWLVTRLHERVDERHVGVVWEP